MSIPAFDIQELRRRNLVALGIDLLYLSTISFFAHMFARGLWPALIAAIPVLAFLYFGWNSSKQFFATQVFVIVITVAVTLGGMPPL